MKQIVLLITLATTATVQAQISFGVKAGVNFAHEKMVNSGYVFLPGTLTSYHGGVYMRAQFGKIGIQPEIIYSRMGGTFNNDLFTGSINTDYYTVPVLFTYSISKRVTLQLGPQFGILNAATETYDGVTRDARYRFKTGDFGIAAGVSVKLPHGFHLGVRYVAGLSDIDNGMTGNWQSKTTNNVLQVFVGYRLIGKD
jgi:hypothetical protein